MPLSSAEEDVEEAAAVEIERPRIAAGGLVQRRQHVDVGDHRRGRGCRLNLARPANDHRGLDAGIVERPLGEWHRCALFTGVEHQRVAGPPGALQRVEDGPDLGVEVRDLGVVVRQRLARLRRIREPAGNGERGAIERRRVTVRPRLVWAVGGHDQEEGLRGVATDEPGGGVEVDLDQAAVARAADHLERKRLRRPDVGLPGEADAIAEIAEVVDQAARARLHPGVIRIGAAAHRVETGVELLASGRAHRGRGEGGVEPHALRREAIEVGRLNVAVAVDAARGPGLVVGEQQDDVGACRRRFGNSGPRER